VVQNDALENGLFETPLRAAAFGGAARRFAAALRKLRLCAAPYGRLRRP